MAPFLGGTTPPRPARRRRGRDRRVLVRTGHVRPMQVPSASSARGEEDIPCVEMVERVVLRISGYDIYLYLDIPTDISLW
jgi:hypothetical protein